MFRHKRLVDSDRRQPQQQQQQQHQKRLQRKQQQQQDEELDEDRWLQAAQMLTDADIDHPHDNQEEEEDSNSSISFAQSGCHSILSAWRIKSASRASRRARPTSVLSNASSFGKKSAASTQFTSGGGRGKSPASQSRIPLGPKVAQHFVTNTRRRRQANELILNTLEARRRVLALNRQNCASLLGSASYLALADPADTPYDPLARPHSPRSDDEPLLIHHQQSARLSLSPSPSGNRPLSPKSPSPAPRRPTAAMSDLGVQNKRPTATQAQRQRLLLGANARTKLVEASNLAARPPLARLDQNSSDLYSTNSSSSAGSSSSESSSGSQFTQLVTSELAPDCILLDEQALKPRLLETSKTTLTTSRPSRSPKPALPPKILSITSSDPPPRVPERRHITKSPVLPVKTTTARTGSARARRQEEEEVEEEEEDEEDEGQGSRFRRGALKRDSIRRLRLNRSSIRGGKPASSSTDPQPTSSSDSSSFSNALKKPQSLSKSRKLDIETNPFLNRHHFRTTSVRSQASQDEATSLVRRGSRHESESQREEPPVVAEKPNKRSSWLFGLSNQQPKSATIETPVTAVKPLPPRLFSEARRSNSSEHITKNTQSGNKKSKQHEEEAKIRRVERMLRQMRPNQVFTSHARETNESMTNQSVAAAAAPAQVARQPAPTQTTAQSKSTKPLSMLQQSDTSRATTSSNNNTMRIQNYPTSGLDLKSTGGNNSSRSETPSGRFVRESSKSHDDLKFDLTGNKRELKVEERWRQERTTAPNTQTEVTSSHRMEFMRSSSISPPPAFADSRSSYPTTTTTSGSFGLQSKNLSSTNSLQQQQPVLARRALSEARPTVAARRRPVESPIQTPPLVPQRSSAPVKHQPVAPRTMPKPKLASPIKQQQQEAQHSLPSLPRFERTADDEFRKRVDYLRRLARANLSSDSQPAETANQQKAPTTKPMSTYWRHSASTSQETEREKRDSASPTLLGPIEAHTRWNYSPERNLTSASRTTTKKHPADTNLDSLLASAGYQQARKQQQQPETPLPGFKWRRSNSSLASVTSPSVSKSPAAAKSGMSIHQAKADPKMQTGVPLVTNLADSSDSDLQTNRQQRSFEEQLQQESPATGTRQLTSSALVKLVVKEKSAPRLDYAFVQQEQQGSQAPSTQSPPPPLAPKRQSSAIQQQQQPLETLRSRQPLQAVSQQSSSQSRPRSPLRVASPRSPDFNNTMATASSNDDSAIASSVSSPSLSFMMNPPPNNPPTETQRPAHQLVGIRSTGARPADNSSGALQSILRRQQQQQQLLQLSESPEVSSQLSTTEQLHQQEPVGAPVSNMKRQLQHGLQQLSTSTRPQSPLFRSNLTSSPDPTGSNGRDATKSPSSSSHLITTATVTTSTTSQSSPPKRVHFNDRTSIRSFESVSSLASNSTAVPNELLRQQVGSPDSMGSGSTSRLSAESPDFRKGGGAAIYAVRGDPELELGDPSPAHHQQHQLQTQTMQPYLFQQPQFAPQYPGNPLIMSHQQQQPQQPFIRMTAPPKITTSASSPQQLVAGGQYLVLQQVAQMSPAQVGAPLIAPKPLYQQQQLPDLDDDEDPDYALRLRQAATSRVFSYAPTSLQQQQQQPLVSPRHPAMHLPATASSPGGQHQQQQRGGGHQNQRHQQQQQPQQQVSTNRRALGDLLNFQTEV